MCDCFARSDFSWTRANAFAFSAIAFCFSGEALDFLRISGDFDGEVLADCSTNLAARSRPSAVANSSEIRAQSVTLETSPPYLVCSLNQIRHAWFAWGPEVQG